MSPSRMYPSRSGFIRLHQSMVSFDFSRISPPSSSTDRFREAACRAKPDALLHRLNHRSRLMVKARIDSVIPAGNDGPATQLRISASGIDGQERVSESRAMASGPGSEEPVDRRKDDAGLVAV